jgi:ELWxxDGT repeat protein
VGGKVYFAANISKTDARLFETDGTADGTRELAPSTATNTMLTTAEMNVSNISGDVRFFGQFFVNDGTLLLPANFHGDGDEVYRFAP